MSRIEFVSPALNGALEAIQRGWPVLPLFGIAMTGACECAEGVHCNSVGKHPWLKNWRENASLDETTVRSWFSSKPRSNYGIVTGEPSGIVVIDADNPDAVAYAQELLGAATFTVTTARGAHFYCAKPTVPVTCAIGVVDGIDVKGDGGYVVGPRSRKKNGGRYEAAQTNTFAMFPMSLLENGRDGRSSPVFYSATSHTEGTSTKWLNDAIAKVEHGDGRNETGFWLACQLRDAAFSREEATPIMHAFVAAVPEKDHSYTLAEAEASITSAFSQPARPRAVDLIKVPKKLIADPDEETPVVHPTAAPEPERWQHRISDDALYGLAGDIVRAIEPNSEADTAALLIHLLVMFGNVIGRTARWYAEGDPHYCNLFAVIVGRSSRGRKGTALGQIKRVFATAFREWCDQNIRSGLSSGEGIVYHLRDARIRTKMLDDGSIKETVDDEGVADKRMVAVETEFASVLKNAGRQGNIVTNILREAWDSGSLSTLTKNEPQKATGAHLSVIGHVTHEDLRQHLSATDAANGFGNRILWICSERSKFLPEGSSLAPDLLADFGARLEKAVEFAMSVGEVKRDAAATQLWAQMYRELGAERSGLYGAVTSRAEPQVMRLACIYALLDESGVITPEHLTAANAVWSYADESARTLFGKSTGDDLADRVLAALLEAGSAGLTKSELLKEVFRNNKRAADIDAALRLLERAGSARRERQQRAGRSVDVWLAVEERV